MRVQLTVELTRAADDQNIKITATIRNDTPNTARLNTLFLPYPSVVLKVQDQAGRTLPPTPPPVPPLDDGSVGRIELAPEQHIAFEYALGALFSDPLPPGHYQMRFQLEMGRSPFPGDWEGTLRSDWVTFSIS